MLLESEKQEIKSRVKNCPHCEEFEVESELYEFIKDDDIDEAIDYAFDNINCCKDCRADELYDIHKM